MISLLIIGLLVVSFVVSKSQPRVAGTLDLIVALLLLFFRVLPGTAGIFDWIMMVVFFLGGTMLFFSKKTIGGQKNGGLRKSA